jgi:hypothetical protein
MSLAPQHWLLPSLVATHFLLLLFGQFFPVKLDYEAFLFQYFFIFVFSICFETDLFVSVVSKRVRNTEINQKINLWFRETNQKTTETD